MSEIKWVRVFVGEEQVGQDAIAIENFSATFVSSFMTALSKSDALKAIGPIPRVPTGDFVDINRVEIFANPSNWVNRKDIANYPDAKPLASDATLDGMGTVSNPIIVSFPAPAGKPSYLFSFFFLYFLVMITISSPGLQSPLLMSFHFIVYHNPILSLLFYFSFSLSLFFFF
jgi:hypothetical protein